MNLNCLPGNLKPLAIYILLYGCVLISVWIFHFLARWDESYHLTPITSWDLFGSSPTIQWSKLAVQAALSRADMPHRASFCHPWRLSSQPSGHWKSATSEPDQAVDPKTPRMVAVKQWDDYVRINSDGSRVMSHSSQVSFGVRSQPATTHRSKFKIIRSNPKRS